VQPVEKGQDLIAACAVERRYRFVHEHDPGRSQQRPRDRDALCLATGQRVDPAVQQLAKAEQFHRLIEADILAAAATLTVFDVLSHVQVREQARFLEHVADLAVMNRTRPRIVLPDLARYDESP
jgi:hypothetical protein